MIKSAFLLGVLLIALAALLVLIAFPSALPQWIAVTTLALSIGLGLGALFGSSRFGSTSAPDSSPSGEMRSMDFSPTLLDATINEMREGLLVIDKEMRVVASNRAARSLFAETEESLNERRLTELTRNPAVYDAFLDGVRGTERVGVKVETYGGGRRVFDLRVVPLHSKNGKGAQGAVGVFFDITRLERLEIIRQEFLSNVSHELRTPLTSIIALTETLEAGAIDDAEHNRRFLSIINKNAARMHRLIDDILELSAIEAGNVKVQPETVPLRPLVEDVIGSLSAMAAARSVTLQNLIMTDAKVFADPHRLVQMLTNLLDNAIKFNREGGTVTVRHEAGATDRIQVEDTGEGIPAHHLDRLFERFYRVERARSRAGIGLGLAIVKHLIKAHGGEVTVSSRFGEGTQFTIELPHESTAETVDVSGPITN